MPKCRTMPAPVAIAMAVTEKQRRLKQCDRLHTKPLVIPVRATGRPTRSPRPRPHPPRPPAHRHRRRPARPALPTPLAHPPAQPMLNEVETTTLGLPRADPTHVTTTEPAPPYTPIGAERPRKGFEGTQAGVWPPSTCLDEIKGGWARTAAGLAVARRRGEIAGGGRARSHLDSWTPPRNSKSAHQLAHEDTQAGTLILGFREGSTGVNVEGPCLAFICDRRSTSLATNAVKTQGKGSVLATKAMETQGKGGVLAESVETQGKGSVSGSQRQWKHKQRAVETKATAAGTHGKGRCVLGGSPVEE